MDLFLERRFGEVPFLSVDLDRDFRFLIGAGDLVRDLNKVRDIILFLKRIKVITLSEFL